MTTKPKAKKFRLRGSKASDDGAASMLPSVDEQGDTPDIGARPNTNANAPSPQAAIDAIRREGLTGRQLRMARRAAQRNGLAPTSDFDAVRLLREKGVDPFERKNMLELVNPGSQNALAKIDPVKLPQTTNPNGVVPAEAPDPAQERVNQIQMIQRDIVRRRQKKMGLLAARLAFFVLLPGIIASYYFYNIATPMYATHSAFLIQQNESSPATPGGGGLAGMLGGGQLATVQDSVAVQGYLTSKEAMLRLDEDHGYIAHFSQPHIDVLSRLSPDATADEAFSFYQTRVKIGYDPTEGILGLEVIAVDPEKTVTFSNALIGYAEQQITNLTQRLRDEQMEGATKNFEDAKIQRDQAIRSQVELQQRVGQIDSTSAVAGVTGQIQTLETQLLEKELDLATQMANIRPNRAIVQGLEAEIGRIEDKIAELQAKISDGGQRDESIAEVTAQLRIAEVEVVTRETILSEAIVGLRMARESADRQTRFLAVSESPILPDTPDYPRAFENSLLAFLIFGGIYLLMSLTSSILREQV